MVQFDKNAPGRVEAVIKNPDMSFCAFILALSMFMLSVYVFYNHRDFNNEYFQRQLVFNKLVHPKSYKGEPMMSWEKIYKTQDFVEFMNKTLALQIFESEAALLDEGDGVDPFIFKTGLIPIGKMRLRQQRRAEVPCNKFNINVTNLRKPDARIKCLELERETEKQERGNVSDYLNKTTWKDWHRWKSGEETKTQKSFYTDDSLWTGDGYIIDFSLGLTAQEFQKQFTALLSEDPHYFNFQTSVIMVTFNCYEPSQDRFLTTSMTVDFNVAGLLDPQPIKIICFSLDQMKQTDSTAIFTDGIQLFFCFAYFYRMIFLKIIPNHKGLMEGIDGYDHCISTATDSLVIMSYLLKFTGSQSTNGHDLEGILNDNYLGSGEEEYVEMVYYAGQYQDQYQMYTVIMILNMYNLLNALRIFRVVHWIMLIIERTFGVLYLFFMLLVPAQLGFSFLSMVFAGPYLKKYSSLTAGFKQQIITMMGQ